MKLALYIRPVNQRLPEMASTDGLLFECLLKNQNDSGKHKFHGTIDDIADFIKSKKSECKVVFIMPGEDVIIHPVTIPTRQKHKIHQALPNLVEEFLAQDPAEMHICVLSYTDSADYRYPVAMVSHKLMNYWIRLFKDAGVMLEEMVPETLLIPVRAGSLSVYVDQLSNKVHCLSIDMQGFTTGIDSCQDFLCHYFGLLKSDVASVLLWGDSEASLIKKIEKIDEIGITHDAQADNVGIFELMVDSLENNPGKHDQFNLLQGIYKLHAKTLNVSSLVKQSLLAASIIAGIQVAFNLGTGFYFTKQYEELQVESVAFYKELFPQDTRIVNLRAQMAAHLDQLSQNKQATSGVNFSSALSVLAEYIPQGVVLQLIRYSDSSKQLNVELMASDYSQLDTLVNTLVKNGLNAELNSAVQDSQFVRGRMSISSMDKI